jgi:hypothetical protein
LSPWGHTTPPLLRGEGCVTTADATALYTPRPSEEGNEVKRGSIYNGQRRMSQEKARWGLIHPPGPVFTQRLAGRPCTRMMAQSQPSRVLEGHLPRIFDRDEGDLRLTVCAVWFLNGCAPDGARLIFVNTMVSTNGGPLRGPDRKLTTDNCQSRRRCGDPARPHKPHESARA